MNPMTEKIRHHFFVSTQLGSTRHPTSHALSHYHLLHWATLTFDSNIIVQNQEFRPLGDSAR